MASIRKGLLRTFCPPDYDGGNVLNLLASILRSRGGRSPHADLNGLPARELKTARTVAYVLVDGLGAEQLGRHLAAGRGQAFFAKHSARTITTVFPATTAAAVTTFSTGASPAEHGILGWHLHLPDLGLVSTILPATTRTGSPMANGRFDLGKYLRMPSHLATVKCRRELISYDFIPESRYSRASGTWDRRRSFASLSGMVRETAAFARRPGRAVAYVYWPGYDSLCHEVGCFHRRTMAHLDEIDAALARLTRALRGTNAALIVTADHGLLDSRPAHRISLREIPGFYDCLAILPSGDARCVQCFVRPSKVRTFRSLVFQWLEKACVCVPGETLLRSGVLGPGRPHPSLTGRVGDFVLIARADYSFGSHLPGEAVDFNEANHGGMSATEVRVPLVVVRC